jgi:hypothetical protein
MDYCSSCRRHLNGALVCPGCGAWAPDIAPAAADGRVAPAPVTMATTGPAVSWEVSAPDMASGEASPSAQETDPADDLPDLPPAPHGRAARRRRQARLRKNQRRAVVATAVALVGGGLTVSAMDRQGGDRAQAATAPEAAGTGSGAEEEQPERHTRPTSARPGSGASSPTPSVKATAPDRPRRQVAAPLMTAPSSARPDAAVPSRTTAGSAAQQPAASPASGEAASDGTGTAATPAPTATGGTDTGQSPASPAPASASPSEVCLLVLCLG